MYRNLTITVLAFVSLWTQLAVSLPTSISTTTATPSPTLTRLATPNASDSPMLTSTILSPQQLFDFKGPSQLGIRISGVSVLDKSQEQEQVLITISAPWNVSYIAFGPGAQLTEGTDLFLAWPIINNTTDIGEPSSASLGLAKIKASSVPGLIMVPASSDASALPSNGGSSIEVVQEETILDTDNGNPWVATIRLRGLEATKIKEANEHIWISGFGLDIQRLIANVTSQAASSSKDDAVLSLDSLPAHEKYSGSFFRINGEPSTRISEGHSMVATNSSESTGNTSTYTTTTTTNPPTALESQIEIEPETSATASTLPTTPIIFSFSDAETDDLASDSLSTSTITTATTTAAITRTTTTTTTLSSSSSLPSPTPTVAAQVPPTAPMMTSIFMDYMPTYNDDINNNTGNTNSSNQNTNTDASPQPQTQTGSPESGETEVTSANPPGENAPVQISAGLTSRRQFKGAFGITCIIPLLIMPIIM
jgi:hypothetical protein